MITLIVFVIYILSIIILISILTTNNLNKNIEKQEEKQIHTSNIKCAVYSQMKDENKTILNWIDHYFSLGFDHLYILDDQSETRLEETVGNHPKSKQITFIYIDITNENYYANQFQSSSLYDAEIQQKIQADKQTYLLHVFKKRYAHEIDWLMICDADEFLYLREHNTINDFLTHLTTQHPDLSGIKIRWLFYGTSYHSYYPENNNHVFNEFVLSDQYLDVNEKSIVKLEHTNDLGFHWCELKPNCNYYQYFNNHNDIHISNERTLIPPTEPIDFRNTSVFLAHYVTFDCYGYIKKKMKRFVASAPVFRHPMFMNVLNEHNNVVNYTMQNKYIAHNPNNVIIEPGKHIDIEEYNRINGTMFDNIYDMLNHFYDNKTKVIYT
jgi:hypothetical protein